MRNTFLFYQMRNLVTRLFYSLRRESQKFKGRLPVAKVERLRQKLQTFRSNRTDQASPGANSTLGLTMNRTLDLIKKSANCRAA